MAQSQRDQVYIATAIRNDAPLLAQAGGASIANVLGELQPRLSALAGQVPAGTAVPVQLATAAHGHVWQVIAGRLAGLTVPYHHPAWSVNPPPAWTGQGPYPGNGPVASLPIAIYHPIPIDGAPGTSGAPPAAFNGPTAPIAGTGVLGGNQQGLGQGGYIPGQGGTVTPPHRVYGPVGAFGTDRLGR